VARIAESESTVHGLASPAAGHPAWPPAAAWRSRAPPLREWDGRLRGRPGAKPRLRAPLQRCPHAHRTSRRMNGLDAIAVPPKRLRVLRPDIVDVLADSIAIQGQLHRSRCAPGAAAACWRLLSKSTTSVDRIGSAREWVRSVPI
jgi:hypothetical protein